MFHIYLAQQHSCFLYIYTRLQLTAVFIINWSTIMVLKFINNLNNCKCMFCLGTNWSTACCSSTLMYVNKGKTMSPPFRLNYTNYTHVKIVCSILHVLQQCQLVENEERVGYSGFHKERGTEEKNPSAKLSLCDPPIIFPLSLRVHFNTNSPLRQVQSKAFMAIRSSCQCLKIHFLPALFSPQLQ